jgi:diphthamide synthase (EF-2-diphthine--ammonia ligase)
VKKILLSWSSGKDSAWMLHVLRSEGLGDPAALLTTVNESANRVAMHAVRTEVLRAQADATGLPLIVVPIPHPCPNDVYEAQMSAAVAQARADGFTHVAFGDLFLEDIRRYRELRLEGTGLTPIFPLWLRPTDVLAREMLSGGLEAYLTCIDPRVLPLSLAGRRFDETLLRSLPPGTDPCGERGEFHTCAIAGPMFSRRVDVRTGLTVERDGFVFTDLLLNGVPRPQTPQAPAAESGRAGRRQT